MQEVYTNRMEGQVHTGQWRHQRGRYDVCGKDLAATSLRSHLETQPGIFQSFVLSRDLSDKDSSMVVPCTRLCRDGGHKVFLWWHFHFMHPQDLVDVPDKRRYLWCNRCGIQVNPLATGYQGTNARRIIHEGKLQR